jgi:hypothetical protein
MKNNKTTAENLEARFDAGGNVSDYFDAAKAVRRNHRKTSEKNKNGARIKRGVAKLQHA